MNKKLGKSLAIPFVAMLFLSLFMFVPATKALPADAIWIEPPTLNYNTTTKPNGTSFTVTVWMNLSGDGYGDLYIYSAKVLFNNAHLKALSASWTNSTKSRFMSNTALGNDLIVSKTIDNAGGFVGFGESCTDVDYVPLPKCDTLVTIQFQIIDAPGKGEPAFDEWISFHAGDTWAWDNGDPYVDITLTKTGTHYIYAWAQPATNPNLAVKGGNVATNKWEYGPFESVVCTKFFDVEVWIENLDAAWGLTNATFCLCYNTTVIDTENANVTLNGAVWNLTTSTVNVVHAVPDEVDIFAEARNDVTPSGSVLVATIKFHVKIQGSYPAFDISTLTFCDVVFWDHMTTIPQGTHGTGEVKILGLLTIPLPWLEVVPKDTVLGPDPSIGKTFKVNVVVKGLHFAWYMVAAQCRLTFDPTLLELVSVEKGGFLEDARWNWYGTSLFSGEDPEGPVFPHHVWFVDFLWGNTSEPGAPYDQTMLPRTMSGASEPYTPDPVWGATGGPLATITFKVIKQDTGCLPTITDYFCKLDMIDWEPVTGEYDYLMDMNGAIVPVNATRFVNGTYTIKNMELAGRIIDVYTQYPSPFGGQGPNQPSDMFWPQKEVRLYAKVTYNCWSVQQKIVGFEIEPPRYITGVIENPIKLTAITNSTGVAMVSFRMLWPCDDPEDLFGVWKVTATVDIACIVVNDTLTFHYDYLVNIFEVTTDKYFYKHGDLVGVTIKFGTHAQQMYPVLFSVVLFDEVGNPVATALWSSTVGGAQYCSYKNYTKALALSIPKFAFAGYAYLRVNCFDKDPTEGGSAYCPEYNDPIKYPNTPDTPGHEPRIPGLPEIYILFE